MISKRNPLPSMNFLILLILLIPLQFSFAQNRPEPLVIGHKYQLHSSVLNEDHTFHVHLPNGYQRGKKKYPVLYVLDAEWLAAYGGAIAAADHLYQFRLIPQVIVVGICNKGNKRNRDTIPEKIIERPGSGGSDKFLEFITTELIPHINQSYRTKPFNILYGGSNAGLLAVYAFIKKPQAFNVCIAGSPMIGHCPEFMQDQTRLFLKQKTAPGRRLFMIYGSDDYRRCARYMLDFYQLLQTGGQTPFKCAMKVIPNGGHVPFTSLYSGLKYVFSKVK